jgi:hypothetical protein
MKFTLNCRLEEDAIINFIVEADNEEDAKELIRHATAELVDMVDKNGIVCIDFQNAQMNRADIT